MAIKIAINGYGRIGRGILRAIYEYQRDDEFEIVAINNMSNIETTVHLTKYDSTHGRFNHRVESEGTHLIIDGKPIKVITEKNPAQLPWRELGIDCVMECTGRFTHRDDAKFHLDAGAKRVLISAPGKQADSTIVYGINHHILGTNDLIVSNASCTTNCLAPIVKPLHERLGIESGLINTVHAYTKDQMLIDGAHDDLRRARSATQSIIPTKTGAAIAVGLVIPELKGKLDGYAMRIPTLNVSAVDLTFKASRPTTVEEVNQCMFEAAEGALSSVLSINNDPLVSCDFNHNPASAIFDSTQTKVIGDLVKVVAWYDNEWGFSNRMLDTTKALLMA